MIKYSLKLAAFFFLLLSSVAHATLITTDLTEDNYVTIGELDWAWASIISANGPDFTNVISGPKEVFEPSLDVQWRIATSDELSHFISQILIDPAAYLSLFEKKDSAGNTLKDGQNRVLYKNAFTFWNTEINDDDLFSGNNTENFMDGKIKGQVSTYGVNDAFPTDWKFETFYVRDVKVPEPSSILIFAIALIALSLRKRAIK
jgi:hypothetical protein